MTKRFKLAVVSILLASVWLWSARLAAGSPRGRRGAAQRRAHNVRSDGFPLNATAAMARRAAGPSAGLVEPQYTGGFHARYFEELPGLFDRMPMRGTAW